MQEIIHQVRPDLIVETGVAHGGSLVFYASMLDLVDVPDGLVVGVDVEIRPHNRAALEAHPTFPRIRLIEGSSTDPAVVAQVSALASARQRVLVTLDSNHTHAHVLRELELYSPLVTRGSSRNSSSHPLSVPRNSSHSPESPATPPRHRRRDSST